MMTKRLSDSKVSSMVISDYIPDGAMVMPVDDYIIWLRCAELPDTYGSLANVLADSTAMETLCNNLNALRYMVRSEDVIMPAVLANSDWVTELDTCAYSIQVPTMTSATTPSGTVSASGYNTTYYPFQAFDKNNTTRWLGAYNAVISSSYIQYVFAEAIVPYKVSITHDNGGGSWSGRTFKLQGSVDSILTDLSGAISTGDFYAKVTTTTLIDDGIYTDTLRVQYISGTGNLAHCGATEIVIHGLALS